MTTEYRSIGTNAGTLYNTGTVSATSGSATVTFSGGASLPDMVGQGDKLTINAVVYFVLSRDSATQVTLQSNASATYSGASWALTRVYTTLAAWESGEQGNLVTADKIKVGVCYNDGAFTSGVAISGWTTDATRYPKLTVAPVARHNGTAGSGARIDLANAVTNGIQIQNDYVVAEWLEVTNWAAGTGSYSGNGVFVFQNTGVLLQHLMIHTNSGTSGYLRGYGIVAEHMNAKVLTIRNCLIYGLVSNGINVEANDNNNGTLTIQNTTVYGCVYGLQMSDSQPCTVQNVISMGNTTDFRTWNGSSFSGSNNLSSDATAPGTSSLTSKTASNQFVTVGSDFHLKAGADAINTGTDLSGSFTTDIDNATRSTPWDIGSDEITASSSRFWIATSTGNWNDVNNWSTSSGGAGGASVPGTTDRAIFGAAANGNCTVNAVVDVYGVFIDGYSGTISQGANAITLHAGGWSQASGTFTGGSGNMSATSFTHSSGTFTAPAATLSVSGAWDRSGGTFTANGGTVSLTGAGASTQVISGSTTFNNLTATTAFVPTDLPGCRVWLDAADAATFTLGTDYVGQNRWVRQWQDKSGNRFDCYQIDGSNTRTTSPLRSYSTLNGLPVVTLSPLFDADGRFNSLGSSGSDNNNGGMIFSLGSADSTVVLVHRRTSATSTGCVFGVRADGASESNGVNGFSFWAANGGSTTHQFMRRFGADQFNIDMTAPAVNTWAYSSLIRNQGTGTARVNGAVNGTDTYSDLSVLSANRYSIGDVGGTDAHPPSEVAEVILYNRALGTQELARVEGYLSAKWGFGATTARTLQFTAGTTQTVSGTTTLTGVSGGLLSLRSTSDGSTWSLTPNGTRMCSYVDVKDGTNTTVTHVNPLRSVDSGSTVNWFGTDRYWVLGRLPLDSVATTPVAGYGLRKLRASYAGAAVRVRRSSDNTQQDIGFSAGGGLDSAALSTFAGVGSAYVAIWYDQSGNGRNLVQATAANQPRIVNSGTIESRAGSPVVRFLNASATGMLTSANFNANGNYTAVLASSVTDNTSGRALWYVGDAGVHGYGGYVLSGSRTVLFGGVVVKTDGATTTSLEITTSTWDGATSAFWVDGVSQALTNPSNNLNWMTGVVLSLGCKHDLGDNLDGQIGEFLLFNSAVSSSDRQFLEASQSAAFTTTLVPAWSSVDAWAYSSGGTGGAPVPGTGDAVYFDGNAVSPSTLDSARTVSSLTMAAGYTGVFAFGTNALTVSGAVDLRSGGTFTGTTGGLTTSANGSLIPPASTTIPNLTNTGGTRTLGTNNLSVAGAMTISGGNLTANGRDIAVAGNWANSVGAGGFTAGAATVTLNGAGGSTQVISGATTFNNLTAICTTARTLNFTSGTTQTIGGTLTLTGASGQLLSLRSTSDGATWSLTPNGTRTCSYVDVRDGINTVAPTINPANSTNSGNTTLWFFGNRYWVGRGGDDNWTTVANWASTSGGSDVVSVPGSTDNVTFDGSVAGGATGTKNCTVNCASDAAGTVASWTQSVGYSGTVTFNTAYTGAFQTFTVTNNATVDGGAWSHTYNNTAQTYRLKASIGGNLSVGAAGALNANGMGYYQSNFAPGGVSNDYRGGSHGGHGGRNNGNGWAATYGDPLMPIEIGSGGTETDGIGGGAIYLTVSGATSFASGGAIEADGTDGNGAGAGGSIYLNTGNLSGAGSIHANGGNHSSGGAGGGGRVAIILTGTGSEFTTFTGTSSAYGGVGSYGGHLAGAGSVYLQTTEQGANGGQLIYDNGSGSAGYHSGSSLDDYASRSITVGSLLVRNNADLNIGSDDTLTVSGASIPPTTTPLLWWKMDESSGTTTADASGNGYTGTWYLGGGATPTVPTAWNQGSGVSGGYAYCRRDISGAGDGNILKNVTMPSPGDAYTVAWWTRPHYLFNTGYGDNFINGTSGWTGFLCSTVSTSGDMYCGTDVGTRMSTGDLPVGTMTVNTWQHFAFVFNAGTGTFYKNGQVVATKNSMTLPSTLAGWGGMSLSTNSDIDEVRVYASALSQGQVQATMNALPTLVVATGTTVTNQGTLSLGGNDFRIYGTADFSPTGNTVTYTGRSDNVGVTSIAGPYHHLTVNKSSTTFTQSAAALTVAGNFTITAGTFASGGQNLNVAGNWANSGTYSAGANTVTLNGAGGSTQVINGTTTFNNLTATCTTVRTLQFVAGTTQTISGTLTLTGASGQLLSLRSSSSPSTWTLTPNGTRTCSYVDVKDGINTVGPTISPAYSLNSGNNTLWFYSGLYWVGRGGDNNWTTVANWASTSGGSDTVTVPGASDNVIFDGAGGGALGDKWCAVECASDAAATVASWTQTAGYTSGVYFATGYSGAYQTFTITGNATVDGGLWNQYGNTSSAVYRLQMSIGGAFVLGASASVDVTGQGYEQGQGPGATSDADGGGHGGQGGNSTGIDNRTYGNPVAPVTLGSGGGHVTYGTQGGGAIHITAGSMVLAGNVVADGEDSNSDAGGGAGGSIWLSAATMTGAGSIRAQGADNVWFSRGGGGGGRVALILTGGGADFSGLTGSITAYGGSADAGHFGAAGTVYTQTTAQGAGGGTLSIIHNNTDTADKVTQLNGISAAGAPEDVTVTVGRVVLGGAAYLWIQPGDTLVTTGSGTTLTVPSGCTLVNHGHLSLSGTTFVTAGTCALNTVQGTTVTYTGQAGNAGVSIIPSNYVNLSVNRSGTTFTLGGPIGTVLREVWPGISGTAVSDLVNGSNNFTMAPSSFSYLSSFDAPENIGTNFGARIRGYVVPPQTGNYTFWIASDDYSELYLSTDANPANKVLIASVSGYTFHLEWDKYPSQQSSPVALVAGQRYYIESLHKEGAVEDSCSVGWQLPDASFDRPISGAYLEPATPFTTVSGNFTIAAGAFACAGGNLTVAGNWTNSGTYISGGSTVTLNGAAGATQAVTGNNAFTNLTATNSGSALVFATRVAFNSAVSGQTSYDFEGLTGPGYTDLGTTLNLGGGSGVAGGVSISNGMAVYAFTDWVSGQPSTMCVGNGDVVTTITPAAGTSSIGLDFVPNWGLPARVLVYTSDGAITTVEFAAALPSGGAYQTFRGFTAKNGLTITKLEVSADGFPATANPYYDNLSIGTANGTLTRTLLFAAGTTQTVSGTLNLAGASGQLLNLRSSSTNSTWTVTPTGTRTCSFVDVRDGINTVAPAIDPTYSVNSGNTTLWFSNDRYWVGGGPVAGGIGATPNAIYSLRRLRSAYGGPAIQVQRSSDNMQQDVGFTSLGDLDQSALTSFVGGGSGYVVSWYDQSGNARDATQTTPGLQPSIVSSGAVTTMSGRPAIQFTGGKVLVGPVLPAMFDNTTGGTDNVVAQADNGMSDWGGVVVANSGSAWWGLWSAPPGSGYRVFGSISPAADIDSNISWLVPRIVTFLQRPGVQQELYVDGTYTGYSDDTNSSNGANVTIGDDQTSGNGYRFIGSISEVTLWPGPLSTTDRTTLETNQGAYYIGTPLAWSDARNWSTTSGGPGGASVPDATHVVIFDANGPGDCLVDCGANTTVASWTQGANYPGTVTFQTTYAGAFQTFSITGDAAVNGGTWKHAGNVVSEVNRLKVTVGGNLTVGAFGAISADGLGFNQNNGPGASGGGAEGNFGGSHGGYGSGQGATYGSPTLPVNLGSGGGFKWLGYPSWYPGGGAIHLTVAGTTALAGTISCVGSGNYNNSGAGAGGSIYLSSGNFTGAGSLNANGGVDTWNGGGGGGRIAVVLTGSGANFTGFSGSMTANGGGIANFGGVNLTSCGTIYREAQTDGAGKGVLHLDNSNGAASTLLPAAATWSVGSVTLNNAAALVVPSGASLATTGTGTTLTVPSGTSLTNQGALTLGGTTFSIAGTPDFTAVGNTVSYTGQSNDTTVTVIPTTYDGLAFSNPSTIFQQSGTVSVNANLNILANTTLASAGNALNVAGNWSNSGTFTAGAGTVTLNGAGGSTQVISGTTTFNNLTANCTTARTLNFTAGTSQTIGGTLTLTGVSGQLLSLRSTSNGATWSLTPNGTRTCSYVDVQDGINTVAPTINPANSTNSGNTTLWFFGNRYWVGRGGDDNWTTVTNWASTSGGSDIVSVPGSEEIVTFDGSVAGGATGTKNCNVNCANDAAGTVAGWTQTSGYPGTVTFPTGYAGAFQTVAISGDATVNGGTWTHTANGGAETYRVNVSVGGSLTVGASGTISGDDRGYTATQGPGYGTGGAHGGLGGSGAGACYGSPTAPVSIGSGGQNGPGGGAIRLTVADACTINGTVTASANGGFQGGAGGSVSLTAATISGTGSIRANGAGDPVNSYYQSGGGGRVAVVLSGVGADFSGLTTPTAVGGGGATAAAQGAAGTVYLETVANGSGGGQLIVDNGGRAASATTNVVAAATWSFGSVVARNAGNVRVSSGTTLTTTGTGTTLTIGSGTSLTNQGTLSLGGTTFGNSGTFTASASGAVTSYTGQTDDATVSLITATYDILNLSNAGTTFQQSGTLSINTGLTIPVSTTLASAGNALIVAGNWTNSGTYTPGANTVTLNGAGGSTQVVSGSTTFTNLTASGSTARTLQFTAGSTQTVTGTLTLAGASGQRLRLRSLTDGSFWNLDPQGSRSCSWLDVQDGFNVHSTVIAPTNSVDTGHNTRWFSEPAIVSRTTRDLNGDGRVDAIEVVTSENLNDDFSQLTMTVAGYTFSSFDTVTANDNTFRVLLSGGPLDTSVTPSVRVVTNTSLGVYIATTLLPTDAGLSASDGAGPALLTATWTDGDTNGLDDGDTLVMNFSESLVDGGVVLGDLALPVASDGLGTSTIGVSGTDLTLTLATAVFTPGGTYAQAVLGQGKPSGIRVASAAHLADGVGNAVAIGSTATARDIGEIVADLALIWNDTGNSDPKVWAVGNMVINSTKTSPTYVLRNVGAATVVLALTCTDTASWTLQPAAGSEQFALTADPGLLGTFAVQVPGALAAQLYSGRLQNFALRLATPTATSAVSVQQSMTVTITASVY